MSAILKKLLVATFVKKKIKDSDVPVRDHCHVTGKYRGSAHNACNLKLKISADKLQIPVFFHNLKGYDSHFIIQKTGKLTKEEQPNISVIEITLKNIWLFTLVNIFFS